MPKTLREEIDTIVIDCLTTGEAERELANPPQYGNPTYWGKKLEQAFTRAVERAKPKIVSTKSMTGHTAKVYYEGGNDAISDYERSLLREINGTAEG